MKIIDKIIFNSISFEPHYDFIHESMDTLSLMGRLLMRRMYYRSHSF